jgi:hypothetical protein
MVTVGPGDQLQMFTLGWKRLIALTHPKAIQTLSESIPKLLMPPHLQM